MEVAGKEHIPVKGGFILASNHLSNLDPTVLGAACPRKLNFMAKENLFHHPAFSWLLYNVGAFPVRRNSADLSALRQAMARLKDGKVLLIFPEGQRRQEGLSKVIQPGVGFLAAKSSLPIVPSFIRGTDGALPKGSKFIRPKKISVCFGRQIHVERSEPPNYQAIAKQIMHSIGQLASK
jgi:1-acyl-sn-glycerol-3-phosphate acyltransferase